MLKSILVFFVITCSFMSCAQEIQSHKWQNRIIIVLANDVNSPILEQQLLEFNNDLTGLSERKLVLYISSPEKYKQVDGSGNWIDSSKLFQKYKSSKSDFELVLIGLDGDVKFRSSEFAENEQVFSIIDRMPMRRQEMRRNGNGN